MYIMDITNNTHECNKCGKFKPDNEFYPYRQTVCKKCLREESSEYYYKHRPLKPTYTRMCKCGKIFDTKLDRQIYCSRECKIKCRRKPRYKKKERKDVKKHERVCVVCGNKFTTKYVQSILCSDDCRGGYRALKRIDEFAEFLDKMHRSKEIGNYLENFRTTRYIRHIISNRYIRGTKIC